MPGIATQFEILRLTIERIEAAGDPNGIAQVMKDHSAYAHLGALGPLLGDFLPSDPFPLDQPFPEDYATLWRRVFHVIGRKDPQGLHIVLQELNGLLDTISTIADNEDCEELVDLKDSDFEANITDVTTKFAAAVGTVQAEALSIAAIIGDGLRPKISTQNPADPVPPPDQWQMRNFLHWKKPGVFVKSLLDKADEKGDDRLRAYAYGYATAYAANTCGSGFINSIVGGPARTQWWRQRFVRNYVDAWVYGFYNESPTPTMMGDTPSSPYESWPNLCSANLQDRLHIVDLNPSDLMDLAARVQPLPNVLPGDFSQNWFEAVQSAYGGPLPAGVNAGALNSAYVFSWLVLWFQTSGSVLGCNLQAPMEPPGGCGESPSELDPFAEGVPLDGNVPQPPSPEIDHDVDEAAIICAIILAILGGLLVLGGGVAAGGALIAGAVALLDCDNVVDLDWQKLRCLIFWERMYLYNALKGIHRLLALAALDYPWAKELAIDEDYADLFPFLDPWESGKSLAKSKLDKQFPGKCWDGSLITFNRPPTQFESPGTLAYLTAAYPTFFVDDDAANPLGNGEVRTQEPIATAADGGRYRSQASAAGNLLPRQFGNAVANAVNLLENLPDKFPNWNLDADRGLAYLTWQFQGAKYNPNDVKVEPEP